MKIQIKSSNQNIRKIVSSDLKDYQVTVNFATYVGADETYNVFSADEDAAKEDALAQAADDLTVESVEEIDDGEYAVSVGFASMVGVEEEITVFADSEEEAEDLALEEAEDYLEVTEVVLA